MSCSFNSATDTLTLNNAFTSGKAADSTISFSITSVRVPLSYAPVSLAITTATAGLAGHIDQGTATITAS